MDNTKLKAVIGELIEEIEKEKDLEEMTGTGAVAGYNTPAAFTKPGGTKAKNARLAKVSGGEVVNDIEESIVKEELSGASGILQLDPEKYKSTATKAGKEDEKDETMADMSDMELAEGGAHLAENRWLAIKNEEGSVKSKLGRGISSIHNQLTEVEKFVNWYSKLKTENGVKKEDYYKRTHKSLGRIKERLMNLSEKIRTL
jgi:hypothetical protein